MRNSKGRVMTPDETAIFCEQISLMLTAGMPIYEGVDALAGSYADSRYAERMKKLSEMVGESNSLSLAMRESGMFPAYMVEMTELGEKSGKLEWVMQSLCLYYQREGKAGRAIRNAITYPTMLLLLMACVIGVLLAKVIPVFRQVFNNMGLTMSASATAMIETGEGIGIGVLIIACGLLVIVLSLLGAVALGKREFVSTMLFSVFPPARRLNDLLAGERFASVMSMMTGSGYPIEDALDMAPRVVSESSTRKRIIDISGKIASGSGFAEAIEQVGLFAPLYCRMIRVGDAAGQLDHALERVAEIYEDEVDDGFSKLVSAIEPTLVAILAVIVGAVLLSVMLPMASMLSGIV